MTGTVLIRNVRAGLAQWTPGRDPDVNLRKAEAALRELARRGCQLAVLPELWLCGYRAATLGTDARAVAEPADGPVQQRLAAMARATGMVICAGTFPELDGGQLYNTAVVYGPDGEPLLRHRKAFLYEPRAVVNLVDYYLIRHGEYDVEAFFDPSGGPYGRVGTIGIVAYIIGIAVEVPFMSTTLYTGPPVHRPACTPARPPRR